MSRHDQLKALWAPGQIWETLVEGCDQWVPVSDGGRAQPVWDERQDYRPVVSAPASMRATGRGERLSYVADEELAEIIAELERAGPKGESPDLDALQCVILVDLVVHYGHARVRAKASELGQQGLGVTP